MEQLRLWAVGLCVASLGGLILRQLAPQKGSGAVFRVMLSAFFLCVFLTPVYAWISFSPQLSLSTLPQDVGQPLLEDTINAQLREIVENTTAQAVVDTLSQWEITAQKIEVETDIAEDGGIYIARIDVWLDDKNSGNAARVRETLRRRFETTVSVKEETDE